MILKNAKIPILGFAAFSGTGKTTLLTQLIPLLKLEGLRVGIIKHSHHNFQIDQPGKDSFRLREAGAATVMLVSSHRRAIITDFDSIHEPDLDKELLNIDQSALDLLLVEGFKTVPFPKIELHRPVLNHPLLYPTDPSIIAIATDTQVETSHEIPQFDLNQPKQITSFILQFLSRYKQVKP